jgi:hypothetical protein
MAYRWKLWSSVLPIFLAYSFAEAALDPNGVLEIKGVKVFPIGFTMPPPPDGRAPHNKDAIEELAAAGATFLRTGPMGTPWDEACLAREQAWLDAAAKHGLYCMPYLREYGSIASDEEEAELRRLVGRFKNHPALGAWKGADEPEWGKRPVSDVLRAYRTVKAEDPDHPVVIIHAPRGTVESLRAYNKTADILGADIYPVGYPPGTHSLLTNKTLSLVGDHTRIMMDVANQQKPVWMVLQIAWSGVIKPGKTLRFPTFSEERFMTYQAIINGARGLVYFGGSIVPAMNERDRELGWNWTFWERVLRPVVYEIGKHGPLYPALLAPESRSKLQVQSSKQIEFCARETDDALFLLACKVGGVTEQVQFSGLPFTQATADVLYEAPRKVEISQGKLKDWFAPYEVHVYRIPLPKESRRK